MVLRNKSDSKNSIAQKAKNTDVSTAAPTICIATDWQAYKGEKFEISIPSNWGADPGWPYQLFLADKKDWYYLNFLITNLEQNDQHEDPVIISLYEQGKLLEAEKEIIKQSYEGMVIPGKIVEPKSITTDGATGLEFVIQSEADELDAPGSVTREIHRTLLKNGMVYRFWTSELVVPKKFKSDYPTLDPSPTELFRKILETFQTL